MWVKTFLIGLVLTVAAFGQKVTDADARVIREAQLAEALAYARGLEAEKAFREAQDALKSAQERVKAAVEKARPKDCAGCTLDPQSLEWKAAEKK